MFFHPASLNLQFFFHICKTLFGGISEVIPLIGTFFFVNSVFFKQGKTKLSNVIRSGECGGIGT